MADEFSASQIELIKNTIAKGATDDELALFMATCKRTGLDPISRQLYMIERRFKDKDGSWSRKMEIQASIDGFRVIAERTGHYQGQDGPYWCGKDGKWTDVWLQDTHPAAAKIGVLKKGFTQPLWGVATWKSYAQNFPDGNPTKMWAKMGDVMLAKCAEAIALRRAFPNDLSGLYEATEMSQADSIPQIKSGGPQVALPPPSMANQSSVEPEAFREAREAREKNETDAARLIGDIDVESMRGPSGKINPSRVIRNYAPGAENVPRGTNDAPMPDAVPDWVTQGARETQDTELDFLTERAAAEPSDPLDHKISFGKYVGKSIRQAGLRNVDEYVGYLVNKAGGTGLSAGLQNLKDAVDLAKKH